MIFDDGAFWNVKVRTNSDESNAEMVCSFTLKGYSTFFISY